MDVGLTPCTDSAFNRASFPLKTLECLSAGLPVVTTDPPASRSLRADMERSMPDELVDRHLRIPTTRTESAATALALAQDGSPGSDRARTLSRSIETPRRG